MPGKGGILSGTVVLVVGGSGKIISVLESTKGPDESNEIWEEGKAKAEARTKGDRISAAYRYNNMSVTDVVSLIWGGSPEQRLERADETYGIAPMDLIGLIQTLQKDIRAEKPPTSGFDGGAVQRVTLSEEYVARFIEEHPDSQDAIAESLVAARDEDDDEVWQRAFDIVGAMGVISREEGNIHSQIAARVYACYYEKLGVSPPPGTKKA